MNDLELLRDAGPEAAPLPTTARSAARGALLAEIEGAGMRAAPRRGRTAALRTGVAVATAAAAWAGAVAVTGSATPAPDGPGGMTLVAVDTITFPLSLDPVPAGMTPSFTGSAGAPDAVAGYSAADGTGFAIELSDTELLPGLNPDMTDSGTVAVAGATASYRAGTTPEICTVANACFEDLPFAELVWERAPGRWIRLSGDGVHGEVSALVALGESLVDRPQPITLQVGLAPAGWSVVDWHESSGAIGVASDEDPTRALTVQCMPEAPPGVNEMDNGSVQGRVDAVTALSPPEETTVGGQPAQVVRAADYMDADLRFWLAAWELPDGTLCAVQTPDDFTRDDVLAIAEGVRYEP